MNGLSRRQWLSQAVTIGVTASGALAILACNSGGSAEGGGGDGFSCDDNAGLDDGAIATRSGLNYTDASSTDGQDCSGCSLYTAAGAGECGGCTVVPGPIHPDGWCTAFVAA